MYRLRHTVALTKITRGGEMDNVLAGVPRNNTAISGASAVNGCWSITISRPSASTNHRMASGDPQMRNANQHMPSVNQPTLVWFCQKRNASINNRKDVASLTTAQYNRDAEAQCSFLLTPRQHACLETRFQCSIPFPSLTITVRLSTHHASNEGQIPQESRKYSSG